jgi:hypothetical protein
MIEFVLNDIDFTNGTITLVKTDETETIKFSFEFIQDINKYITKEWEWKRYEPLKK